MKHRLVGGQLRQLRQLGRAGVCWPCCDGSSVGGGAAGAVHLAGAAPCACVLHPRLPLMPCRHAAAACSTMPARSRPPPPHAPRGAGGVEQSGACAGGNRPGQRHAPARRGCAAGAEGWHRWVQQGGRAAPGWLMARSCPPWQHPLAAPRRCPCFASAVVPRMLRQRKLPLAGCQLGRNAAAPPLLSPLFSSFSSIHLLILLLDSSSSSDSCTRRVQAGQEHQDRDAVPGG